MFTATARSIGGIVRHEVNVDDRHTIVTDAGSVDDRDRRPRQRHLAAGDQRRSERHRR
jgi:hypothetical protein